MIDLLWIAKPDVLGIDARHYQRAASAWLAGGDPWKVTEGGIPFAAGPHTLLFYAPTSVLPLSVSVAVWMVLGVAAAVWMVRRLDIPIWWIAFPPLAHALWNGNPQSIVLALLVAGGTIAAIAAVGLKLYAAVPAGLPAAPAGSSSSSPSSSCCRCCRGSSTSRTASACPATSRAPGTAAPGASRS